MSIRSIKCDQVYWHFMPPKQRIFWTLAVTKNQNQRHKVDHNSEDKQSRALESISIISLVTFTVRWFGWQKDSNFAKVTLGQSYFGPRKSLVNMNCIPTCILVPMVTTIWYSNIRFTCFTFPQDLSMSC